MNPNFQVSVIIPVYNCEKYLSQAVESALDQEEAAEVILIEDCSPDNALEICQNLEKQYSKVKLYQHSDKKNHGAGASRNLGIEKAQFEYIAFLDGDDYYLEGRFQETKDIFKKYSDCDAVYVPAIINTTSDNTIKAQRRRDKDIDFPKLILPPDKLIFSVFSANGWFNTNSITVKKECIIKVGCFNENLRLLQDTECWLKLALKCNLYPGNPDKILSVYRLHNNNRSGPAGEKFDDRILFWNEFINWCIENKIDKKITKLAYRAQIRDLFYSIPSDKTIIQRTFIKFYLLAKVLKQKPYLIFDSCIWRGLFKVFGFRSLEIDINKYL